jgi:hypothetical protein
VGFSHTEHFLSIWSATREILIRGAQARLELFCALLDWAGLGLGALACGYRNFAYGWGLVV